MQNATGCCWTFNIIFLYRRGMHNLFQNAHSVNNFLPNSSTSFNKKWRDVKVTFTHYDNNSIIYKSSILTKKIMPCTLVNVSICNFCKYSTACGHVLLWTLILVDVQMVRSVCYMIFIGHQLLKHKTGLFTKPQQNFLQKRTAGICSYYY